jgi:hypothetical protein
MSLVLCGLACGLCCATDEVPARAATMTFLKPVVDFTPAHPGKKALKLGDAVYAGDTLATGEHGGAAVVTADGSQVRLGPNTQIILREVRQDAKGRNFFEMARGLLLAMVRRQGTGAFTVRTPHTVAAVKGTQWQIEESGDHAEVRVLSGTVQVQDPGMAQSALVNAGEGALSYNDRVSAVRKLDKAELAELRQAFASRVFQAKKDYSERVKRLQGK